MKHFSLLLLFLIISASGLSQLQPIDKKVMATQLLERINELRMGLELADY